MYILLNKDGKRVGQLSNDGAPGSTPFWNDLIRQQIADDDSELTVEDAGLGLYSEFNSTDEHANTKNYNHALESISIPYGYPETDEFTEYARLVYQDKTSGHYYEMILTEVTDEQSESGTWFKSAIGVNSFIWQMGHLNCLNKTYSGAPIKEVATDLLSGSGWTLGECVAGGSSAYQWETEQSSNRQAVMQQFCQQYNVELDAYILFNTAGQIVQRKVDMVQHLGTDTGLTLRTGVNVQSITRTVSADNLFTRLVVLGKNGETIESVNDGLTYVQDVDANDEYNPGSGFLEGVIQSQTIANPSALKTWGKQQLQYFNHPKISYQVSGLIDAGLGDTVRIQSMTANPELTATSRVIQKTISQSDPTQNQALVGEFATVKAVTPSLISSLRSEFSVNINDILSQVQQDGSALSVHLFTPDGTDFSIDQSQKRVIGQAYVNNKNITEFIDPRGWRWTANNEDGTVNTEFNSRKDTAGAGYLQVVNDDFRGVLNVAIDTAYIETDPERSPNGIVVSKTFTDSSDTTVAADLAYTPNGIYKLTQDGKVWKVGTTDVMALTHTGATSISGNDSELYLMNDTGQLVAVPFQSGTTVNLSTAAPIGQFSNGVSGKYDPAAGIVVVKSGNQFNVYSTNSAGATSEPLYSIPDYHSVGFSNSIVSWAINWPRIYAVTDAHTLIGFNAINQSPLFEWEPITSGGLAGSGLQFVAAGPTNVFVMTSQSTNLVQELSIVLRDAGTVTENPNEELKPTAEEAAAMDSLASEVDSLAVSDTYKFGFITDTHLSQAGTQAMRRGTRHLKTIGYYAKNHGLPLIIHGGDMIDGSDTRAQAAEDTRAAVGALGFEGVPVIYTNGNHDDNSGYARDVLNQSYSGILSFNDRFVPEFSKSPTTTNPDDKTNPYGYYIAREDLWIVVLNAFDFPYRPKANGQSSYIPHARSAFRIGQLRWLDGILQSVPDTTQVLFISHVNLRGVGTNSFSLHARNGNLITDMISAFNNSGKVSEQGLGWNMTTGVSEIEKNGDFKTSLSVDYTGKPTGRVIGVLCGHTHTDADFVSGGVHYIETLCSASDRGEVLDRTGLNEDAWDVVEISTTNRTLDLVRYGAGTSRVRHYDY